MCATYRFEGGTTRLRIKARTTEGDYGDVRLTVVAKISPKKSAQARSSTAHALVSKRHRRSVLVNQGGVGMRRTLANALRPPDARVGPMDVS